MVPKLIILLNLVKVLKNLTFDRVKLLFRLFILKFTAWLLFFSHFLLWLFWTQKLLITQYPTSSFAHGGLKNTLCACTHTFNMVISQTCKLIRQRNLSNIFFFFLLQLYIILNTLYLLLLVLMLTNFSYLNITLFFILSRWLSTPIIFIRIVICQDITNKLPLRHLLLLSLHIIYKIFITFYKKNTQYSHLWG